MSTVTLDQALDIAMQLSPEEREMLLEIIYRREIEARRQEIAENAQASLADFYAGKLHPQSAKEVIAELQRSLDDEE